MASDMLTSLRKDFEGTDFQRGNSESIPSDAVRYSISKSDTMKTNFKCRKCAYWEKSFGCGFGYSPQTSNCRFKKRFREPVCWNCIRAQRIPGHPDLYFPCLEYLDGTECVWIPDNDYEGEDDD